MAFMGDLRKCYEHVKHWKLASEARTLELPLVGFRVALASYRWPRIIALRMVVAEPES